MHMVNDKGEAVYYNPVRKHNKDYWVVKGIGSTVVYVYEAVVTRLAMLGYTVTDDDKTGLEYTIHKCEAELLVNINHRELPPPLFYTLVDMVAGQFLFDKKAAGGLEGFDFEAPAKSITEGDISVTFAGASDGASNAESRFDAMLSKLMHPAESTLAAFRRLRW